MGTAVVTGAGSGMGRATAARFIEAGWTVVASDVAPAPPDLRSGIAWHVADVRDRTAVERAVASVGTIDALANVAGVYPPTTLETFTDHLYRTIFDINVLGVVNVTAACVPHMSAGSSVVNFASVDAFTVSPGQLLYGASKAAVVMLTKSLALELAPRGIRVNGIAPGWVNTPGNAATGRMSAAAASIPLGRVAEPDEIAEWAWLLTGSGVAGFVAGETIVIAGGDVLR
jgi:NAD(P)-dependent dehydrogenase (short-subunit alcohol dehydrogenase family)